MNDLTGSWTDGRAGNLSHRHNQGFERRSPKYDKYKGALLAWGIEFPGVPQLHYYGSSRETYRRLAAAGWKFSSVYGWRKVG